MKVKMVILICAVILVNILAKACKDDKTDYLAPGQNKDSISTGKKENSDTMAVETARVVADSLPPIQKKKKR